jgi:hypothetical protein
VIEHFIEEFVPLASVRYDINDVKRFFHKSVRLDASVQLGGKNRSKIEVLAMGTLLYRILE